MGVKKVNVKNAWRKERRKRDSSENNITLKSHSRSNTRRNRGYVYKTSLGGHEDSSFINNTRGSISKNPELNGSFSMNLKQILNRSTYVKKIKKKIKNNFQDDLAREGYKGNKEGGSISEYRIYGKKLGEGAYAVVRPAKHLESGDIVALKTYNRLKLVDPKKMKAVRREIEIIKEINHPQVANFINCFENRRNIHLVLENAGKNNLMDLMAKKPLGKDLALKYFKQVVQAIVYIHGQGIAHRDLKLENVVVNEDEEVKLVDFGFARKIVENEKMDDICGTPNYMSPELCKKGRYNGRAADVWALGIILYYLLVENFPFEGKSERELFDNIIQGEFDIFKLEPFPEEQELLSLIFMSSEAKRPSAIDILESPILKDIDTSVIISKERIAEIAAKKAAEALKEAQNQEQIKEEDQEGDQNQNAAKEKKT